MNGVVVVQPPSPPRPPGKVQSSSLTPTRTLNGVVVVQPPLSPRPPGRVQSLSLTPIGTVRGFVVVQPPSLLARPAELFGSVSTLLLRMELRVRSWS